MARRDAFLQGSIRNLREFEDEGSNFKAYRESQLSIPMAVVAQSMYSISKNEGSEFAELSSRMGGSRYSRLASGLVGGDEEDAVFQEDK